jgi:uncharacterized protein YkwD
MLKIPRSLQIGVFLFAAQSALACNAPHRMPSGVESPPEIKRVLEVCKKVNLERRRLGLNELQMDLRLNDVAHRHARDMYERNYFDHDSPEGRSVFDRLVEAKARFMSAGENIAWGQRSAQEVMDAWMDSPGHRANILQPRYRRIGVGLWKNRWVQVFTD